MLYYDCICFRALHRTDIWWPSSCSSTSQTRKQRRFIGVKSPYHASQWSIWVIIADESLLMTMMLFATKMCVCEADRLRRLGFFRMRKEFWANWTRCLTTCHQFQILNHPLTLRPSLRISSISIRTQQSWDPSIEVLPLGSLIVDWSTTRRQPSRPSNYRASLLRHFRSTSIDTHIHGAHLTTKFIVLSRTIPSRKHKKS